MDPGRTTQCEFIVKRKTATKQLRAKGSDAKHGLTLRRHEPIPRQDQWPRGVVKAYQLSRRLRQHGCFELSDDTEAGWAELASVDPTDAQCQGDGN